MKKEINELVVQCNRLYMSSHYWHWIVKNESQHNATAVFYEEFEDVLDSFVECAQGQYKFIVTIPSSLSLYTFAQKDGAMDETVAMCNKFIKQCDKEDLKNIAAELIEKINRLKYRFTLS